MPLAACLPVFMRKLPRGTDGLSLKLNGSGAHTRVRPYIGKLNNPGLLGEIPMSGLTESIEALKNGAPSERVEMLREAALD